MQDAIETVGAVIMMVFALLFYLGVWVVGMAICVLPVLLILAAGWYLLSLGSGGGL